MVVRPGDALVESPESIHQGRNNGAVPGDLPVHTVPNGCASGDRRRGDPSTVTSPRAMNMALSRTRGAPRLLDAPAQADDQFGIYIHVPALTSVPTATSTPMQDSRPAFPHMSKPYRETEHSGNSSPGDRPPPSSVVAPLPPRAEFNQGHPQHLCRSSIWHRWRSHDRGQPQRYRRKILLGFTRMGVNRLSIGAQTLDRRGLRVLGRRHEADHVASAVAPRGEQDSRT